MPLNIQVGVTQTVQGRAFNVLDPRPEHVFLEDIAHSLSMICRFNGHTHRFYSVAEHCARGALLAHRYGREVQREFLLHDAHEAYVGDITTPVKAVLGRESIELISAGIDAAVVERFGLARDRRTLAPLVKKMDTIMLFAEADALLGGPQVGYWPERPQFVPELSGAGWGPEEARDEFLEMAEQLGIRELAHAA